MSVYVKPYIKAGNPVKGYARGGKIRKPPTVIHGRTQLQKNSMAKVAGDRARKIQAYRKNIMSRRGWARG